MTHPSRATIIFAANDLIDHYGAKARQKVIDEILVAVRNHDIDTAKLWDEIGQAVDALLVVPNEQLSFF